MANLVCTLKKSTTTRGRIALTGRIGNIGEIIIKEGANGFNSIFSPFPWLGQKEKDCLRCGGVGTLPCDDETINCVICHGTGRVSEDDYELIDRLANLEFHLQEVLHSLNFNSFEEWKEQQQKHKLEYDETKREG